MTSFNDNDAVVIDAVRTPMGRAKNGCFRFVRAENLSSVLVDALLDRNASVDPSSVDDLIWGCVNQTKEQGFNIARHIGLMTRLPSTVPAMTVNRLCGSSMSSIHIAAQAILSQQSDIILVGGVEHMGHVEMTHGFDHNPAASKYSAKASNAMGLTAELLARINDISLEAQNKFSLASHQKAQKAVDAGCFSDEIIPVDAHDADGLLSCVTQDETIRAETTLEALSRLPPAFDKKHGTVTAGNSSQLSDGASAMLMMSYQKAKQLKLTPMARVRAMSVVGVDAAIMGYAPVPAIQKVLARAELTSEAIQCWEVNEAFAAQVLTVFKHLKLTESQIEQINRHGGAIALGHPLGCSGTRISTTLLHTMQQNNIQLGVSSMCVGLGQGIATIWEQL